MKLLSSTFLFVLVASLVPSSVCAQQKDVTSGEHIFSANCAACHGSDGRGGERAPDIATTRAVVSMADTDLENIVKKGIPSVGMPSFGYMGDQKVSDVVAYLRVLQGKGTVEKVTGDPKAGRTLFFGKAECAKCHMVNGEGGFIASDLSTYGDNITAANLRNIIVNPDQSLPPASKVVEIRTLSGQRISGLVREEDNFRITLQTEDGRFHMYAKAKLASVVHTSHSIMPADYGSKLSSKELDDLTSFLITNASSTPHTDARAHKRKDDDDVEN
jgi:putative heme-binding domain-containing protein